MIDGLAACDTHMCPIQMASRPALNSSESYIPAGVDGVAAPAANPRPDVRAVRIAGASLTTAIAPSA